MRNFLKRAVIVSAMGAGFAAFAPGVAFGDDAEIKLIGSGPRRKSLDELSYQTFDASKLSTLSGWSGMPVAAESFKGRPALIVMWASWFRPSYEGLTKAQTLADLNADLLVFGVHHQRGYERAAETAGQLKVKMRMAHDSTGELAKAMFADKAGPVFYVVDRAGRLRFADVDPASLDAAVKLVVEETEAQAAAAAAPVKATKKSGASGAANAAAAAPKATEEEYANAKWPKHNAANRLSAKSVQGKKLAVEFGKHEDWITPKVDLAGKVVVLDYWATWCPPCLKASPILAKMQADHKGQVEVIAVGGQGEPLAKIKDYLSKHPAKYNYVIDAEQHVYKSLAIKGIPHVVVLSTDGVVRWQGNPLEPAFVTVVKDMVAVDPGIVAGSKEPGTPPKP